MNDAGNSKMKNEDLASIDVGTTKICSMIANITEHGVHVVGLGVVPTAGLHRGFIVNVDEAREAIRHSVKEAERTAGKKMRLVCVGVTGRHITSAISRGAAAVGRSDRKVASTDLERVLRAASSVKIPRGMRLLHVIPRTYAVDGQTGITNPVGMHGFRLDVDANIISASVTSVQNLVKCIRGIGIEIDDLVFEPLACAEAVLTNEEKGANTILVDIGGQTTDVSTFKYGTLWHNFALPVGGYHITRDIAIGLGLPFDIAEGIKTKYGKIAPPDQIDEEGMHKIEAGEGGHTIMLRDLYEIIYVRVEELLDLIRAELPIEYELSTSFGVVLTGGSSKLPDIELLAGQKFSGPIRVATPKVVYEIPGYSPGPELATAVGLLLWQASSMEKGRTSFWKKKLKPKTKAKIDTPETTEGKMLSEEKSDETLLEFEEARSYFRRNRKKLLAEYQGKYIAIFGSQVVDSDEDFGSLAERVYRKLGYRAIYMPKVVVEPTVIRIPSPRIFSPKR